MIGALVHILIVVLILGLVFWLLWWALSYLPLPAPFAQIARLGKAFSDDGKVAL